MDFKQKGMANGLEQGYGGIDSFRTPEI